VRIVRTDNIDDINFRIRNQLFPVGVMRLIAPFVRELFCFLPIPCSNRLEHGLVLEIEKLADGQVRISNARVP
jgi:hypothetical protein